MEFYWDVELIWFSSASYSFDVALGVWKFRWTHFFDDLDETSRFSFSKLLMVEPWRVEVNVGIDFATTMQLMPMPGTREPRWENKVESCSTSFCRDQMQWIWRTSIYAPKNQRCQT